MILRVRYCWKKTDQSMFPFLSLSYYLSICLILSYLSPVLFFPIHLPLWFDASGAASPAKKSPSVAQIVFPRCMCFNKQLLFQGAGMWLLAETNVCLLEIVFILRSTFAVINLRDLQLPSVSTGVFVLCFISLCEFVYVWGLRSKLKVTIWKYNVLRDTLTSICVPVFLCYSWFVGVFV